MPSAPPIAQIALDIPVPRLFDYLAPGLTKADIGQRVRVPFGRKEMVGVVMGLLPDSSYALHKLKPVLEVYRDAPALSTELLRLLNFCSDYYHYPLGATVMAALPTILRRSQPVQVKLASAWQLTAAGLTLRTDDLPARAPAQRALLDHMRDGQAHPGTALAAICRGYRSIVKAWVSRGWAAQIIQPATLHPHPAEADAPPQLTAAQQDAVAQISAAFAHYQAFLLHGITGSGKTEVYLHLVAAALARGGQVLLLVPEINLTPQLTGVFRARFPHIAIATLHSGMAEGERLTHWLAAAEGRARIVLGTRLAVFAALPQLALLIVDEEHDSSFHQQDGLRYAARDVAVVRAQQRGVPVVLGSATPALETWHNAQGGRYTLISLNQRAIAHARLPTISLLDTRSCKPDEGLSATLLAAIRSRLDAGQQSLVFVNRRGYSPALMCFECGWSAACTRCSAKLVLHLREHQLRCHHCGHVEQVVHACPACGNLDLKPGGFGTQRIEDSLTRHFPQARILRVDRDSTRKKHSWPDMQRAIRKGAADILVGTQLLAKGHDFPKLTLVGVINADSALYSPDFRATERLFAQLMQVGGRAGRAGAAGEVLIQTQFPEHHLYRLLQRHDYAGFAASLLAERAAAGFPPFVHQAVLRAEAGRLDTALAFLHKAQCAAPHMTGVTLFDPTQAAMARKAGAERALLLVQSPTRKVLQAFLSAWMPQLYALKANNVRWNLDVDPLEI
ncbi:primosomal protein N' [Sulfuriferula plumbiphila]|uniref:Replication restart protein PriA n=1 Tax=Sulfuriferula plumbiphila TaxID=171865 RepID=A0A512L572_9PROT|nr:primosomal protein N' [Sulfuriferula plumbiphila]BBP05858.1 primosomal protein N' [Sulfuriferula plumbiphila]GEP29628.1 primosomal protein N' [Sulfuriferula plumbiphila]